MHKVIEMRESDRSQARYGVMFSSVAVHKIEGAKHNRNAWFRVNVWASKRNDDGTYTDSRGNATEWSVTVTASAEATVIQAKHYGNLGLSVHGEALSMGESVWVRFPDGGELGPFIVSQTPLHDPHFVPTSE